MWVYFLSDSSGSGKGFNATLASIPHNATLSLLHQYMQNTTSTATRTTNKSGNRKNNIKTEKIIIEPKDQKNIIESGSRRKKGKRKSSLVKNKEENTTLKETGNVTNYVNIEQFVNGTSENDTLCKYEACSDVVNNSSDGVVHSDMKDSNEISSQNDTELFIHYYMNHTSLHKESVTLAKPLSVVNDVVSNRSSTYFLELNKSNDSYESTVLRIDQDTNETSGENIVMLFVGNRSDNIIIDEEGTFTPYDNITINIETDGSGDMVDDNQVKQTKQHGKQRNYPTNENDLESGSGESTGDKHGKQRKVNVEDVYQKTGP